MIVVGLLSGTSMDGLDVAVAEIEIAGGLVRLTPLGAHTTPWIAERTGLPVVSDLRGTDIAAGGHGAPLASTLDALWLAGPRRRAALNLGGIANITVVGPADEPVVSFDTGPGNCLLDVVATRAAATRAAAASGPDRPGPSGPGPAGTPGYDVDGALAAAGTVDTALLAELLAEKYYAAEPPKSAGRRQGGLPDGAARCVELARGARRAARRDRLPRAQGARPVQPGAPAAAAARARRPGTRPAGHVTSHPAVGGGRVLCTTS